MGKTRVKGIMQGIFLLGFVFLIFQDRLQTWIIVLGLGILLGVFFGRVYCGWLCPMGTVMRMETWIYHKLGFQRKAPILKNGNKKNKMYVHLLQALFLIIFFGGMIATRLFGIRINLIVILVMLGVGISLFFKEEFWHRICPHGIAMSLSARIKQFKTKEMVIKEDECIGCGQCEKICPNLAIEEDLDGNKRRIITKDCLVCFECGKVCPTNAIIY